MGLALLANRRRLGRAPNPVVEVEGRRLSHDQLWFLAVFVVKIGLRLVLFRYNAAAQFRFLRRIRNLRLD